MIGLVAYELAFPACMKVYNVFHASLLKPYIPTTNHVTYWNVIQVEREGDFPVQIVSILGKNSSLYEIKRSSK